MSSLLLEPGLEANIDAAWSKTTESKWFEIMQDIFNGEMLQNFKGPDGKPLVSAIKKMKDIMYFHLG